MNGQRFHSQFALFASLILGACLAGCSSSDGSGGGGTGGTQQELTRGLFGTVTSSNGTPLAGVTVEVNGATATTDQNGQYVLETSAGQAVAKFRAPGHLQTLRRVAIADGSPTATHVQLRQLATAQSVSADTGGMVEGQRSAAVMISPDALSGPGGSSVTGNVDVYLTPLDPSDEQEVQAVTGGFEGLTEGQTELLESFGMLDVTIMQGEDELEVAAGESLTIRIPPPANVPVEDLPPTMPLWSLDEETGQWVEEGVATYDAESNTYIGEITHMSAWNADRVTESTCITGLAEDPSGAPIAGSEVDTRGIDYNGSSTATTGADGRFYIPVRKNSEVSVSVTHQAGGGVIRTVMSGSTDTTVPPTPGDPNCLDIGTFTVQRGVVFLPDGTAVACDGNELDNIFTDSCAAGLTDVFLCWNPMGECTFSGTGIMYSNGARLESSLNGDTTFFSPSGEVCGTSTIASADPNNPRVNFTTRNGETYVYIINTATSDLTIQCPNGETVTLTGEDQQVLAACSGQDETIQECTGDIGPIDGTCVTDADCPALSGFDFACCDLGLGTRSCTLREVCDLL